MQPSSYELYVGTIFAGHFDLDETSLHFIHKGVSLVFEASQAGQPVILKITSSDRDESTWAASQLGWVHFLRANGLLVPELIPSNTGLWLESLLLDGRFYSAYAYHRMPITPENVITWQDASTPALAGETMGKMHRLAKDFGPPPGSPVPGEEGEIPWLTHPEAGLHPSQEALFEPIANLRRRLSQFPVTPENYGWIHDDFHTGNIFQIGNQMAVIDFGCCRRGWFAQDIATALLFRVWIAPEKETLVSQAEQFLRGFITGYRRRADFQPEWLAMFPDLLKLRELSLFQSDYGGVDASRGSPDSLFEYLFHSIQTNQPFLRINFNQMLI